MPPWARPYRAVVEQNLKQRREELRYIIRALDLRWDYPRQDRGLLFMTPWGPRLVGYKHSILSPWTMELHYLTMTPFPINVYCVAAVTSLLWSA